MRIITSDWHVSDGGPREVCDRDKVTRLVAVAVRERAQEVIIAGDGLDATRGSLDGILAHSGVWLRDTLQPLADHGIMTTFILGNHDWLHGSTASLARAIYACGVDPRWFQTSSGPEIRGRYQIEHGNRFDPMCQTPGGLSTRIGEAATKLVGFLSPIIGSVDPAPDGSDPGEVPALDNGMHRDAIRWAYAHAASLIMGHVHLAMDIGGPGWRVLDCGSCTKGTPFSYVWIGDGDETAGVVIEP